MKGQTSPMVPQSVESSRYGAQSRNSLEFLETVRNATKHARSLQRVGRYEPCATDHWFELCKPPPKTLRFHARSITACPVAASTFVAFSQSALTYSAAKFPNISPLSDGPCVGLDNKRDLGQCTGSMHASVRTPLAVLYIYLNVGCIRWRGPTSLWAPKRQYLPPGTHAVYPFRRRHQQGQLLTYVRGAQRVELEIHTLMYCDVQSIRIDTSIRIS